MCFILLFLTADSYPTQSGISEFAQVGVEGTFEKAEDVVFPWCLLLYPIYSKNGCVSTVDDCDQQNPTSLPKYMQQLESIPEGSHLYDIYAIPGPEEALGVLEASRDISKGNKAHIQRIGRLITTSPCVWSVYDKEIFFKHQKKEDDYALMPEWEDLLTDSHKNIGAADIEKMIAAGIYENNEL